jgi:capsule biosynthesis phosphatase
MTTKNLTLEKYLIVDIDGTLTKEDPTVDYADKLPRLDVIAKVNELHRCGIKILLYSARNMRTYQGNIGSINVHTLPVVTSWLERYGVKYHEIYMGKPWCGTNGIYIRTKSVRPDQFLNLPLHEIERMLEPTTNNLQKTNE